MSFLATPGLGKYVNKKTGIFDKLGSVLFGDKDQMKQQSLQTPGQEKFFQQFLQLLSPQGQVGQNFQGSQNYLSQFLNGNPQAFEGFAAPYKTQFQEQVLPGIAERFAGLNPMGGGLMTSGFGQALGGAGAQFQSNLAGLYSQLQQQAANQAMNQYGQFSNQGLGTRAFENVYQPGNTGLFGGAASGLASGIGQAGGISAISKLLPLLGLL